MKPTELQREHIAGLCRITGFKQLLPDDISVWEKIADRQGWFASYSMAANFDNWLMANLTDDQAGIFLSFLKQARDCPQGKSLRQAWEYIRERGLSLKKFIEPYVRQCRVDGTRGK